MNIGDHIRVEVNSIDATIWNKTGWKKTVLEGTVVKGNERLDPPDSFNLLTGNPEFPVSIIQNSAVVKLEVLGRSAKLMISDRPRMVKVELEKGHVHTVTIHNSGLLQCNCLGFTYRRKCKHRDEVLTWLGIAYGKDWKKEIFV